LPRDEFSVTNEKLPGLMTQECTAVETLEIVQDVAHKLIQSHYEHGGELSPLLQTADLASGNIRISRVYPDGKICWFQC
jgi:hypothetical protein